MRSESFVNDRNLPPRRSNGAVNPRLACIILACLFVVQGCGQPPARPRAPQPTSGDAAEMWQAIWDAATPTQAFDALTLIETEFGHRLILLGPEGAAAFDLDGEMRGKSGPLGNLAHGSSLAVLGYQNFGDLNLPVAIVDGQGAALSALLLTPAPGGRTGFALVDVNADVFSDLQICSGTNQIGRVQFVAVSKGGSAREAYQASVESSSSGEELSLRYEKVAGDELPSSSDTPGAGVAACSSITLSDNAEPIVVTGDQRGLVSGPGWTVELPVAPRSIVPHPRFSDSVVALDEAGALWSAGPNGRRRIYIEAGLSVASPTEADALVLLPYGTPGYAEGGLAVLSNASGRLTFLALKPLASL